MLSLKNNIISFVIPCYNESKRINTLLDSILEFQIDKYKNYKLTFIIINDGSIDDTETKIKNHSIYKKNFFKLITYKVNKGKGYALMQGINASKSDWVITIDVDLSVTIREAIKRFNEYFEPNINIYFGSRNHSQSLVYKKQHRQLIGSIFNIIIQIVLDIKIKDTQCGFKIYQRNLINSLSANIISYGYTFDLELAFICSNNKIMIKEIPVNWVHKEGSKVNLFIDSFKMLIDIFKIRFRKNFKLINNY